MPNFPMAGGITPSPVTSSLSTIAALTTWSAALWDTGAHAKAQSQNREAHPDCPCHLRSVQYALSFQTASRGQRGNRYEDSIHQAQVQACRQQSGRSANRARSNREQIA